MSQMEFVNAHDSNIFKFNKGQWTTKLPKKITKQIY